MGKVNYIEAETDNGSVFTIRNSGVLFLIDNYPLELTTNDIEQMLAVIHYLRQVAPFETVDTKTTLELKRVENE